MTAGAPAPGGRVGHARTASILAIAELAGKVASFAMFAVAARILGAEEFGEFSWALNLGLMVSVLVIWGYDTALIQLARRGRWPVDELLGNLLALRVGLIPVCLVIAAVATSLVGGDVGLTLVMGLAVLLDSVNQAIRSAAAALQRQRNVALNLAAQRLVTAGLAIAVLLGGGGVHQMALAYLAGTLVGVGLMYASGRRIGLHPRLRRVTAPGMRVLATASTALGISNMLNMLVFRVDALLLGWLLDSTAVGAYSVAYKLFETVLFILWSLDRVALPAMTASEGVQPVRRGVHRTVSAMFSIYVPYLVIVGIRGEDVLDLFFGQPYGTESLLALQLLLLALIPYGLQYLFAAGLLSRARNTQVTVAGLVAVIVNVASNLALIPRFGPAGAAAATLVAMIVQSLVLWALLRALVGGLGVLRAALLPALAVVWALPVLMSPMGLLPAVAVAGALYGLAWMLLAKRVDPIARSTVLALLGVRR